MKSYRDSTDGLHFHNHVRTCKGDHSHRHEKQMKNNSMH